MKKKIVEIVSVDPRYRKVPYPSFPVYDETIGNYLTGQHYDPRDPSTSDYLTKEEIEGKTKISNEKMKRFPFVILINDDFLSIPIIHRTKLDISTDENGKPLNPKDYTYYNYFINYCGIVAPSKDKVNTGRHYFYILDKEYVMETKVSKRQLIFKAMQLTNNIPFAKMFEVALILNYRIKESKINPSYMTALQLQDIIGEYCESNPQEVINAFTEQSRQELYVLKLVHYGILTLRDHTNFYDGSQYVGNRIEEVIKFMRSSEGASYATKWNKLMENQEGQQGANILKQEKETPKENENKIDDIFEKIDNMNLQSLKRSATMRKFPEEEWSSIEDAGELRNYIKSKVSL